MNGPWRLYFYDPVMRGEVNAEFTYISIFKSPLRLPVVYGDVKITRDQGTKTYYTLSGGTISVRGAFSQPSFELPDLYYDDMQEMEFFLNMCFTSNKVLLLYHDSPDPWDPTSKISYPVVAENVFSYELIASPDQISKPRYRVKAPKFVAVTSEQYPRGVVMATEEEINGPGPDLPFDYTPYPGTVGSESDPLNPAYWYGGWVPPEDWEHPDGMSPYWTPNWSWALANGWTPYEGWEEP